MADHTKAPPTAAVTEPSDGNAAIDPRGRQRPDWSEWRKRPTISVRDGVQLAHNVRPSSDVWEKLKGADDPRVPLVGSAYRTASLSMATDPRLTPIAAPLAERQRDRLRQKVDIHSFAAWAVDTIDSPFMSPEFRALVLVPITPKSSSEEGPDAWDRSIEILRKKYPSERPEAVTRRLQSMARMLIAVAVDRHGLEVDRLGERSRGTIAAFEGFTANAGFAQMDGDVITGALSLAVDLVGRERVMNAVAKRAAKHK